VPGQELEMLTVVAGGCLQLSLGQLVGLDVVDHKQVLHSHLEAAGIDCTGLGLDCTGLGLSGGVERWGGLLHLFYVHGCNLVQLAGFAAVAVGGTSVAVFVAVGHTEVAVAVLAAVVAAAVEVVIAAAVAACIVVGVAGMAAAVGLHMVVVGCLGGHLVHQPYVVASG